MRYESMAQDDGGAWVGFRPTKSKNKPESAFGRLVNAVERLLRG